jgi:uncharacterized repeat protein (TIGR01451 family)
MRFWAFRSLMLRRCLALGGIFAAALLISLLAATKAQAQAGTPFFCDSQFYQVRSDTSGGANNNTAYLVRYPTLTATPNNAYAAAIAPAMNALGFNPRDNYLYAVAANTTPHNQLYRFGQNGIELVGAITGLTGYSVSTAGVFDKQGRYYLMGQGGASQIVPNTVFRIDNIPVTGTAALTVARSYALSASLTNVGDIAFSDAADGINGTLYGATNQGGANVLARIALNDAAATAAVTTLTWATPNIGGIGSAFYDQPTDRFYVFNNGASRFYEITNFASGTPGATTVTGIAPGFIPGTFVNSSTDGASCIFAGAQQANMGISKSVTPTTAIGFGQTVTFGLVVSNLGTSPAGTTTVTDNLPPGLAFVSASTAAGTYSSATGLWTLPSLPSNTSATLTLVASVSASGTSTASFANVATVGQGRATGTTTVVLLPDPSTANNTSTATPTVAVSANLQISKTNNVTTLVAGNTTSYTITVSNLGTFTAANSLVTDGTTTGLACSTAPTCSVVAAPATCPATGVGPGQLSIGNLQGAGVQIPSIAAGGRVAIVVTCGVTATGL